MLIFRLVLAFLVLTLSSITYSQTQLTGTKVFSKKSSIVNFTTIANRTAEETQKAKASGKFIDVETGKKLKKENPQTGQPGALNNQAIPPAALSIASPGPTDNFLGFPGCCTVPPDTQGAVGPNHIVTATNGIIRIQSRTGQTMQDLLAFNFWQPALTSGFYCCDPRIWFDPYGGRWIMSAFSKGPLNANGVFDNQILVAVSQTNDPTGNWNVYSYTGDPAGFREVDFPTLGFNGKWIVVSAHALQNGPNRPGVVNQEHIFVIDKQKMYAGLPIVPSTLFQLPNVLPISPVATYDANLEEFYLVDASPNFGPTNSIRLSSIAGPVGSETFTFGLALPSATTPWSTAGLLMPQLGAPGLNGASSLNAVYRNGSIWFVHSVSLPAASPNHQAVQWWQLSPQGLVQQRGVVEDLTSGVSYGAPSIAVNANNDTLIGYSAFSATTYPSGGYSFRSAADPLNETRLPVIYKPGEIAYRQSIRWGDYSSTVVDPVNDVDMWTIQEYATPSTVTTGASNWNVWWAKVSPPISTACVKGSLFFGTTLRPWINTTVSASLTDGSTEPHVLAGSVATTNIDGNFCVDGLPLSTPFYLVSPQYLANPWNPVNGQSAVVVTTPVGFSVFTSNTGGTGGSCALPTSCIDVGVVYLNIPL